MENPLIATYNVSNTVPSGASTGCIKFSSSADGLAIDSAKWTPDLDDADYASCSYVPTLTEYGLLILAILIVVSAVGIMWRRRKLTASA